MIEPVWGEAQTVAIAHARLLHAAARPGGPGDPAESGESHEALAL